MATKLGVAPNYFTSFVDGQGAGASDYFTYAEDLDTNFVAIKSSVNALIDEVQAVNGPAGLIAFDLTQFNDPIGGIGTQLAGVLGGHSYIVTTPTGTSIDVSRGQAILQNTRVSSSSVVTFSSITGDGTKYIALDAGGVPFLETAAGQRALDVARITMTGGVLVESSLEQLAPVFPDGDAWNDAVSRDDESGVWATGATGEPVEGRVRSGFRVFRGLVERFRAIERLLIGLSTEDDGNNLPALGLRGGSAGAPAFISTDGSGTRDTTTGWFRQAANAWGFSASGSERFRFGTYGIRLQNGSEATPPIAGSGDTDTGVRFGSGLLGMVVAGADVIRLGVAQAFNVLGSAGSPSYTFDGDGDTGVFSPGANRLGFATAGAEAAEFDPQGNLDLNLQTRGEATTTGESLADGATFSTVSMDAEVRDVGGSFAAPSADITVPTGADGTWQMIAHVEFDESTIGGAGPNTGQRGVAIQVDGNTRNPVVVNAAGSGDTRLTTVWEGDVVAANVLRVLALQDNDDNSACTINARVSWRKVA